MLYFFTILEVFQLLQSIDLHLVQGRLTLPCVVHMRPVLPLYKVLLFHFIVLQIQISIWIPIIFHVVDCGFASRSCKNISNVNESNLVQEFWYSKQAKQQSIKISKQSISLNKNRKAVSKA